MDLTNKKLLILGGTSASLDLVRTAKAMGLYVIVTDNSDGGVAKALADETACISTADIPELVALCREKQVDGIFCGPSEFNLRNVIRTAAQAGLPCYTTMEVWERCANKDVFKSFCREYGVDHPTQYTIHRSTPMEQLEQLPYPIIIKPVDGCSSAGLSVCRCAAEVPAALEQATAASRCGRIIAEQYIENGGALFSVRYLLRDGEAYPYFLMDTYVVDPSRREGLISGYTSAPSMYADYYLTHMDAPVRRMLKGMGLTNGVAFIQALPYGGKIYLMEMGYRLSGGMLFKLTEPLAHVHDMQMMLRGAVGGPYLTDEEIGRIDLTAHGKRGCQLMVPLREGTVSRIDGLEAIAAHPAVCDCFCYYREGDTVSPAVMGTLGQHFCRITFTAASPQEEQVLITYFQDTLRIYDTEGQPMNVYPFDPHRRVER